MGFHVSLGECSSEILRHALATALGCTVFFRVLPKRGYRVYIGIMEKKMETTVVYWVYIGIMEKKMEATIMGRPGFRV